MPLESKIVDINQKVDILTIGIEPEYLCVHRMLTQYYIILQNPLFWFQVSRTSDC